MANPSIWRIIAQYAASGRALAAAEIPNLANGAWIAPHGIPKKTTSPVRGRRFWVKRDRRSSHAAASHETERTQAQQRTGGRRLRDRGCRVVVGDDQVGIGRESAACEICISLGASEHKFGGVGRIPTDRGPDCGIGEARACGRVVLMHECLRGHRRKLRVWADTVASSSSRATIANRAHVSGAPHV